MNIKHYLSIVVAIAMVACKETPSVIEIGDPDPAKTYSEEYYSGGKLGTVFNATASAYEQPSPAVENGGYSFDFQMGEYFFEKNYNTNSEGAFHGLGPLAVREGCLYCHPAYGHGKRQDSYHGKTMGNGYLLVLYEKMDGQDSYLSSLTGMPQTLAYGPFKAPIDEDKIRIEWKDYTDEWGNRFSDGETYSLIYPEVTIPEDAYYVPLLATVNGEPNTVVPHDQVGVLLESTIGIYGTGLIDAIPDDSITAQWSAEEQAYNAGYLKHWKSAWFEGGAWKTFYSGLDGNKYVRRFTYAMSRGPVQDGAGANAIWNITNVTRPDRRYHYMTAAYAEKASKDPEVQAGFAEWINTQANKTDNPEFFTDDVEQNIYNYLMSKNLPVEMTEKQFTQLMVWHRGLAVPAARNIDDAQIQHGKELFSQIGCARCHRPSWTTGADDVHDPNNSLCNNSNMPRYPYQKIWPYTDMVQHKLCMVNDIRTGWCRTTPLWGRGLSKLVTGAEDRLHDCRARNTLEAIMWHGSQESDARESVEQFRQLSKEDREAVIKFIDAI
ncbi:MAG: hypothetical protein IJS05_03135 [Paludibacteraceae bacterium]|nr:hypothetical protein [Paludibacteraceae bacterium]